MAEQLQRTESLLQVSPMSLASICYGKAASNEVYSLVFFSSRKGLHVGRHDFDQYNLTVGLMMEILVLPAKRLGN